MTTKTYYIIKLAAVFTVSAVAAMSVLRGHYLALVPLVVIGSALMYFAKRKVKGVVEDERDHVLADKAAGYSMMIYMFLVVMAVSLLMNFQQTNPSFYLVASVLLYAVIFQMMVYAFIFFLLKYAGQPRYIIGAIVWFLLFLLATALQLTGRWASVLPRQLWQ